MLSYIVPLHQYEIRFSPMIDFSSFSKKLTAPYVQRVSSFNVENENTMKERISLNFGDDEAQSIFVWYDRIVFRSTVGLEGLDQPNSLTEEAFFGILDKLKEQGSFGSVMNSLFYTVGIIPQEHRESGYEELSQKYLNLKNCELIMPSSKDMAVTLVTDNSFEETTLTFGPYVGLDDFNKRNVKLSTKNIIDLANKKGTMFDYKAFSKATNNIDFRHYRNLTKEFFKILDRI